MQSGLGWLFSGYQATTNASSKRDIKNHPKAAAQAVSEAIACKQPTCPWQQQYCSHWPVVACCAALGPVAQCERWAGCSQDEACTC